jgi:formylglycine-generating enzyme required for sulfatase activity
MADYDEKPQRTVDLPEYWIGRTPVTNDQFARFVAPRATRRRQKARGARPGLVGQRVEDIKGAELASPAWARVVERRKG